MILNIRPKIFILLLTALTIGLSTLETKAQFLQDIQGNLIRGVKYTDVNGNPYLTEQWTKGTVLLKNGRKYANVQLRYDLVGDEVLFKDEKSQQMMSFTDPVIEFQLNTESENAASPMIFRSGYVSDDGIGTKAYFQVLCDQGVKLLKKQVKVIIETKEYSSATSTKNFSESTSYYLYKNNKAVKIRKDKKQIFSVLGNQTDALEKFIKDNNLNLKNESDLIRLVAHYNSL
jgi:hypothetical protein